jgi:hypothetical protein
MRFRTGRRRWLALLFTAVPLAFAARSELNLARGQSIDPALTALILTEEDLGHDASHLRVWLHGITDMSLPADQQKQVVLSNLASVNRGRYVRVSPGRYVVDVECERRHGINRSFAEELIIDAEAGKTYAIGCVERTIYANHPRAYVREAKSGIPGAGHS